MNREKKSQHIQSISPSFCLAKWLQVTIDLVHGTTHSCHHPERHDIPLEELEADPSALHNTKFKMQQRKMMLDGVRPPECEYCWKIEDTKGLMVSDRFIKSLDDWAYPRVQEVIDHPWDKPINPAYVELMLDNTCNFSCSYCFADISTSISREIQKFGPLNVKNNSHRVHRNQKLKHQDNPFLDAFWKWLPTLLQDLKVLRLTGGEPLLSAHTQKILQFIETQKTTNLTFAVNTNLGVDEKRRADFFSQMGTFLEQKKIKSFELYTSIDTVGAQAEYIRNGLNYKSYTESLVSCMEQLPGSPVILMCTFNILSIPQFDRFIEVIYQLKRKYPQLVLDISYLKEPEYLRANMANEELLNQMRHSLQLMESLSRKHRPDGYTDYEVQKLKRILDWMESDDDQDKLHYHRSDFFRFIKDYDKRTGKSFQQVFPELESFYKECYKSEVYYSKFLAP